MATEKVLIMYPRTKRKKLQLLQNVVGFPSLCLLLLTAPSLKSQVIISSNYSQNFDSLGSGIPAGWQTYSQVSSNSLGSVLTFTNTNPALAINSWSNTTGAFKNLASSTGLAQTSNVASQQASLDRALGIRTTGTFGDTATNFSSINFNFSTVGIEVTGLSLDAMVLATEGRTKLWDLQYGIGTSPTSWTTLASFSSGPDWITQSYSFTTNNFGSLLDNQANIWFRFSSTTPSTGSGSRPTVAIDNFALQVVPEPSTTTLMTLATIVAIPSLLLKLKKRKTLKI